MRTLFPLNRRLHAAVLLTVVSFSFFFYAYSSGITGVTQKPGSSPGCTCHNASPNSSVSVTITGPDTLQPNQTGNYTVVITGGPLVAAGTNIAASAGTLTPGTGLRAQSGELTHTTPKTPSEGSVTFSFTYKAPSVTGNATLYANGNSVDLGGGNDGDSWNFALNKVIRVLAVVPVELTSFTASSKGNTVTLHWSTATETNNQGFTIERAAAAGNGQIAWAAAGFVNGKGTTAEPVQYSFSDAGLQNGSYLYRLKQTDFDGTAEYYTLESPVTIEGPEAFTLLQNYPNPFNPATTISYYLPVASEATLTVFDAAGNSVAVLAEGMQEAGTHTVRFIAAGLASGIYYYKLQAGTVTQVKKLMLLK